MNDRPQRTELKKRLQGADGGYDFHRSLHLLARRYVVDGEPLPNVLASAAGIQREPERNSATAGMGELARWRLAHPGASIAFPAATFESAGGAFKVKFDPTFGVDITGTPTAVHLWNTKRPELVPRFVYGALSLFRPMYAGMPGAPADFAVLSLRDGRLYRLSEVGDYSPLGLAHAAFIDRRLEEIGATLGLPRPPRGRPAPPPPPL